MLCRRKSRVRWTGALAVLGVATHGGLVYAEQRTIEHCAAQLGNRCTRCNAGRVPSKSGTACVCTGGTHEAGGQCVRKVVDPNQSVCRNAGGNWTAGGCECPGERGWDTATNECVCPPRTHMEGDRCVVDIDPNQLACRKAGGQWSGHQCTCPFLQSEWDPVRRQCVCREGTHPSGDQCEADESPEQIACEQAGARWLDEQCQCSSALRTWDGKAQQCVCQAGTHEQEGECAADEPPSPPEEQASAAPQDPWVEEEPPPPRESKNLLPTLGWVATGTGAALLVTGAIVQLSFASDCYEGSCPAASEGRWTAAQGLYGGGAVLLVGGVVARFTAPSERQAEAVQGEDAKSERPRGDAPIRTAGWATLGSGAALLAAGAVFHSRSAEACTHATCASRRQTEWTVAQVLYGVGAGGLLGGAALLFAGSERDPRAEAPASPFGLSRVEPFLVPYVADRAAPAGGLLGLRGNL